MFFKNWKTNPHFQKKKAFTNSNYVHTGDLPSRSTNPLNFDQVVPLLHFTILLFSQVWTSRFHFHSYKVFDCPVLIDFFIMPNRFTLFPIAVIVLIHMSHTSPSHAINFFVALRKFPYAKQISKLSLSLEIYSHFVIYFCVFVNDLLDVICMLSTKRTATDPDGLLHANELTICRAVHKYPPSKHCYRWRIEWDYVSRQD